MIDSCTLTEPSVKPTTEEKTHYLWTSSTMNLAVWTMTPSGYNAEYNIDYTFTDSSNNALPSWIPTPQITTSNIVFTFTSSD